MRPALAALLGPAVVGLAFLVAPVSGAEDFDALARAKADSSFNCEGNQSLTMRFGSLNGESIAAVMTDGARHVLTLQPWDGVIPQVVWSDGARTLTWDVGVRIMWMDGAKHLSCGRRAHNH